MHTFFRIEIGKEGVSCHDMVRCMVVSPSVTRSFLSVLYLIGIIVSVTGDDVRVASSSLKALLSLLSALIHSAISNDSTSYAEPLIHVTWIIYLNVARFFF